MKLLLELRSKKADLHAQMKNMVETAESEKRSLSKDEDAKFKALQESIEETNASIQRAEVLADNERSLITGPESTPEDKAPSNAELRTFIKTGDVRSLTSAVDADGGFAVVPTLDRAIYKLLRDNSVFRSNATVKTTSSKSHELLVSTGGTTASWAAEGDTRGETSTSNLESIEIRLNSLFAYPSTTQELLDWSDFDIAGWLTSEVAEQTGVVEEASFWNGDGVKKPNGLLTYPTAATDDSTRAFGTIQEIETAAANTLTGDDLITFVHKLRQGYRSGAKFYMNDAMLERVRKLKDSDNNYLWRPGIAEGSPSTLLGKAVEIAEAIPDDQVVYGDLAKAYTVLDHTSGIQMIRDNITSKGFVKMFTTRYVGGGLVDSNAIKSLKIAAA